MDEVRSDGDFPVVVSFNTNNSLTFDTTDSIKKRLKNGLLKVVLDNLKSRRSIIWQVFGNVVDDTNPGKSFPFTSCSKCFQTYKALDSGTTTSLLRHIKSDHLDIFNRFKKDNANNSSNDDEESAKKAKLSSPSITNFLSSGPLPAIRKEKLDDAILKLMIDRCLPFECANAGSLRNLVYTALNINHLNEEEKEKIYKPLDESSFRKNHLPIKYKNMHNAVKKNIIERATIGGGIERAGGVTTDCWTDKYRGREYMSVHYQFLDDEFKMNTHCLGCIKITAVPFDNVAIASAITKVLNEFEIKANDIVFTTDSDAKLKKACAVNHWQRIACIAHDMHLLVQRDGFASHLKDVPEAADEEDEVVQGVQEVPELVKVIKGCRAVVEYFKRGKGQRELEERGGTALKIDVTTRWNSTFIMIKSVLDNYGKVMEILIKNQKDQLIRNLDKPKLEMLHKFLGPFFQATMKFSSQTRETLVDVWPTVASLNDFLRSIEHGLEIEDEDGQQTEFPDLEKMRKNMMDGISSPVGRRHIRMVVTDVHKYATFFDPRLKHLPFTVISERKKIYQAIENMILDILINYQSFEQDTFEYRSMASMSVNDSSSFGADKYYRFDGIASINGEDSMAKKAKSELNAYLTFAFNLGFSKNVVKSIDFPLIFWSTKGKQFLTLVLLARKYLSIPATSVPSEEIFATAGRIISEKAFFVVRRKS